MTTISCFTAKRQPSTLGSCRKAEICNSTKLCHILKLNTTRRVAFYTQANASAGQRRSTFSERNFKATRRLCNWLLLCSDLSLSMLLWFKGQYFFFPGGAKNNGAAYSQWHLVLDDIRYMPSIVLDYEGTPVNNTGRNPCLHGADILTYVLKESSWLLWREYIKGGRVKVERIGGQYRSPRTKVSGGESEQRSDSGRSDTL